MDDEEKYLVGFVLGSDNRFNILQILNSGAKMPATIAKEMGVGPPYMGRMIKQLCDKGLVECYTEKKKTWKVYGITDLGRWTLKKAL